MALDKPKSDGPPESPTTARGLDFDDEDLNSSPKPSTNTLAIDPNSVQDQAHPEEVPPPQPPRPLNPRQQAENTLKDAFPAIDAVVVRAVLTASGGQIEPAFNALLGMSDPDSQQEAPPPPQPPRALLASKNGGTQSQLAADEAYARRLAEQYDGVHRHDNAPRNISSGTREPRLPRPKQETGLKPSELYDDREHSFIDDDLPIIRENIRKGFLETQSKAMSFITSLKKKIEGDDEDELEGRPERPITGYNTAQRSQQYGGRRTGDVGRRSGDRDRYDADPQVLGDDFAGLQMRDETALHKRSNRPLANPDLFKSLPTPANGNGRQVSFQEGPPEEIDDLPHQTSDQMMRSTSSQSKSKWQPLSAVDPSPITDHDPFSLADSDEEDNKKKESDTEAVAKLESVSVDAAGRPESQPEATGTGAVASQDRDGKTKPDLQS